MGLKTITMKEDVYNLISSIKKDNENFSDVLRRELSLKGQILWTFSMFPGKAKLLKRVKKRFL
jgi:predicted CopG family antitoxin